MTWMYESTYCAINSLGSCNAGNIGYDREVDETN